MFVDNFCCRFDAIQYPLTLCPIQLGSEVRVTAHDDEFVGWIFGFSSLVHSIAFVGDRTRAVESGIEVGFGESLTQDGG